MGMGEDEEEFNHSDRDDESARFISQDIMMPEESNIEPDIKRKGSKGSLVSNAQLHFQILVEDVKGELKGLTQGGTQSNNYENEKTGKKDDEGGRGDGNLSTNPEAPTINTRQTDVAKTNNNNNNSKEDIVLLGWRRYIGILMAISSSMFFALAILIVKSLPQYHPFNVSLWRFQGIFLPSIPVVIYYRLIKKEKIFDSLFPVNEPGRPKNLFLLFLRGLTGAGASTCQYYSLQYINMADSSVIVFSTPVFVSLASHFLLGEKSGIIPVMCGVMTIFGVVVIARPPMLTGGEEFDTETLIGTGIALGSMVLAATTFILLRYLRRVHFAVVTLYFGLYGSVQSLALAVSVSSFQLPQGYEHWIMAASLAILTFLGQTLITLAFKYEQAGTVSLCRTFDIIFAYIWQFIFLGVIPDIYSMIGGAVVVCGVVLAAMRKFISELPEDHQTRKRLWILLK